jgi:hypothetical protein
MTDARSRRRTTFEVCCTAVPIAYERTSRVDGYVESSHEVCAVLASSPTHPFCHSIPSRSQCFRYTLRMRGIQKAQGNVSARSPVHLSRRRQAVPGLILTAHERPARRKPRKSNSDIERRQQEPDPDLTPEEQPPGNTRLRDRICHGTASPSVAKVNWYQPSERAMTWRAQ